MTEGLKGSGAVFAPRDSAPRIWRFADVVLDERSLELRVLGKVVEIERKPLEVLIFMLQHAGEVVTKEELAAAMWPGRIITDSTLTKCVAQTRQAIGDTDQAIIRTAHGYGYRLVAPVTVERPGAEPAAAQLGFKPGDAPPLRPSWKLARLLGSGGRGEVWLAEQPKTRETRVYKFALHGGALISLKREITLSRLLKQALPGRGDFVRLIDWNLEEPPYFTESEHVAGGNLRQWAEARGGLRSIALPERLELLAQVADALAAAHSVGVLHKDLKPANIFVAAADGPARIKLADFGSGALLDAATIESLGITQMGLTQTFQAGGETGGETSGTLLYLAPEVMTGQPFTTQADLYALGLILYQMVVGDFRKPLAEGWEKDVDDELLREDIAHAVAGNPADRLGDAAEMARRMRALDERRRQRTAQREAQARAERARIEAERARDAYERASVRRRWMAATIGVLVAGLAVSFGFYVAAKRSSQEAAAVSEFLLNDMLTMASPYQGPVRDLGVRDVLDRTASAVDGRFAGQPQVAAQVRLALGQSYWWLRLPERARRQFEMAAAEFERLHGADDGRTLRALEGVARSLVDGEDPGQSRALLERIESVLARTLPPNHPRLLQLRIQAALALYGVDGERAIANLRTLADEAAGAEWRLLSAAERLFHFHTYGDDIHGDELAQDARFQLGNLLARAGQLAEARDLLAAAVAYFEKRYGDAHYLTALARLNLASTLVRGGADAEAEPHLLRAEQDLRTWMGDDHEDVKAAVFGIATLRLQQGRSEEALAHYDEVARRCVVSACAPRLAHASQHMVAVLQARFGDLREAGNAMRSAVANAERLLGPQAAETIYSKGLLGSLLFRQGDLDGAARVFRELLATCQGTGDQACAPWKLALAETLVAQSKPAEARPLVEEVLAHSQKSFGADDPRTRAVADQLAAVDRALRRAR